MSAKDFTSMSVLLETFFTEHLLQQRQLSTHTIASYRDTFRLLLQFAAQQLHKPPSRLSIGDLDASAIRRFLSELETQRRISSRTRNQRLAAIRSCFRFAALHLPEKSHLIQQVLAIPSKRCDRKVVHYLTADEIRALLGTPDKSTWSGLRDYTLLLLGIQTGLRVSELRALRLTDVRIGATSHLRCIGKGRKERCTPLTRQTAAALKTWLKLVPPDENAVVFPNAHGEPLSTDGIAYILRTHAKRAACKCASLAAKSVTPHVLRHTAAMRLLQAGVDRTVIALWLGHESVETTTMYLEADLRMKQKAINKTKFGGRSNSRYRPTDKLLAFLNTL